VQVADARAVRPLIAALKDGSPNVREAAAEALVRIAPLAVGPLVATLSEGNSEARRIAAETLEKIGVPAVEPLIASLKNSSCEVVAETLAQIGVPAVEPLIATLKGGNSSGVRSAAVKALVKVGARAVEPLIDTLRDSKWEVRKAAAEALRQIGDPRAVEPLVGALRDRDSRVRRAAAEALEATTLPSDATTRAWYAVAKNDWTLAASLGGAAVEPLIAALKDGDADVCGAAAEALGSVGLPPDPVTRAWYAVAKRDWTLAASLGGAAVEALIAALKEGDSDVRATSAKVLGEIGDARAVEPLMATARALERTRGFKA
jgi:HEAT repeat protein